MFGKSSISKQLFDKIKEVLPEGSTILEFGMGGGTEELLRYYNVNSVEHNPKYANWVDGKYTHAIYLAPLVDNWYDPAIVAEAIKRKNDLILIDGPPGILRANFNFSLFEGISCPVIFDDVNRNIDNIVMKLFCLEHKCKGYTYEGNEKSFALCTKK